MILKARQSAAVIVTRRQFGRAQSAGQSIVYNSSIKACAAFLAFFSPYRLNTAP